MYFVLLTTLFLISTIEFVYGKENKRLLLHDDTTLAQAYQTLADEVKALKSTVAKLQSGSGTAGGSLYVRWGRTSCPATGSHLVYSGYAAGTNYDSSGGATNHLCLPPDPQWYHYDIHERSGSRIYGVEYEFSAFHKDEGSAFFHGF